MSPMLVEAIADQVPATDKGFLEVSIIMPCLNEAHTLVPCIAKAKRGLKENRVTEEMIVADNGIATEIRLSLRNSPRV
jgi:hypothetical protein